MLRKKKATKSSAPACTSTASGGILKCVLEGVHSAHATAPAKRGRSQYATWFDADDGQINVMTYSGGKKQSEWLEAAPPGAPMPEPKTEPAKPEHCGESLGGIVCTQPKRHTGDHVGNGGTWTRDRKSARFDCAPEHDEREDDDKDPDIIELEDGTLYDRRSPCGPPVKLPESWTKKKPAKAKSPKASQDEANPAVAPHVCANAARDPSTGKPLKGARAKACEREFGHDGPHRIGPHGDLEYVVEWEDSKPGWVAYNRKAQPPLTLDDEPDDPVADEAAIAAMDAESAARANLEPDDDDDPYEDEVRSDADRELARQQREAREAHAREVEAEERAASVDRYIATEYPAPLTKIGDYEVHPAAALFPLIEGAEYEAFRDDIRTNGQRKRIVCIGGLILDGRNRLRACVDLGIEPKLRSFGSDPGDGDDPIAFVVSENVQRRHLNETQRAFVGAELVPMYEAQARERMLAGTKDPTLNSGQGRAPTSAELAARAVNVGKASVEAALKVKRDAAPEVLEAAKERGQIKVSTAAELAKLPQKKQREIVQKLGGGELRPGKVRALVNQEKKRDVVRKINEQRVAPMPAGPFGVIYGDYPWHYDNSDQHEGSRGHLGYPTMKLKEVLAHARDVAGRAAKDCVIALWSTNLYITRMDAVIEAFGAERRTVYTWPKPKWGVGGWGRGQTEHLVIASIGEPTHTLNEISTLLPSWRPAHPTEHSSKPTEVAALLMKHCGGPFLELFGREPREGWAVWGAETDKFKGAA